MNHAHFVITVIMRGLPESIKVCEIELFEAYSLCSRRVQVLQKSFHLPVP